MSTFEEDLDQLAILLERGLRKRIPKKSSPSNGLSKEKPSLQTSSHSTSWKVPTKTKYDRKAIIVEYTSSSDELSDDLNSSSSVDDTRREDVTNYSFVPGSPSRETPYCIRHNGFLSLGRGSLGALNAREKRKLSELLSKKIRSQSADAVLMAERVKYAKKAEETPSQTKSSKSVRWKPGRKLESHRLPNESTQSAALPNEKSKADVQPEIEALKKQHRNEIAELTSRNQEELLQTQRNAEEKYQSLRLTLDLLEAKLAQAMITSASLHSLSAEKKENHELQVRLESTLTEMSVHEKHFRADMEKAEMMHREQMANLEELCRRQSADASQVLTETMVTKLNKQLAEWTSRLQAEKAVIERELMELQEAKTSNERLQMEIEETRQRLRDAINAENKTQNWQAAFKKTTQRKLKDLKANHMASLAEIRRQSRAQMEVDRKRYEERHSEETARHAEELKAAVDRLQAQRDEIEEGYKSKLLEASMNLRDALEREKARTCSTEETLRRREREWLEADEARQAEEEQRSAQMLPADVQSHLESVINSLRAQVEILRKRAKLLEEANASLTSPPGAQNQRRIPTGNRNFVVPGKGTSKHDYRPTSVEPSLCYGDFPPPPAELLVPLPKGEQVSEAGEAE
ncbi:unnamed protein product [Schistocephalus solidus]|uniref:Centrosomal protein of 131 kDa n=1 Tax=Schistocephalus solidus TaxID=70667 RepID=A0A183SUN1_SCHSO|nr:unnamed protein product [Schistocephalus solidus]